MAAAFKSWRDYVKFSKNVRTGRRYLIDAESREFLSAVRDTCAARAGELEHGSPLFRAQIASSVRDKQDWDFDKDLEVVIGQVAVPCGEERLRPYSDRAKEGRANPKGVPVFYAASDQKTAIAEVRPWNGAFITVGHFTTRRALKIIDCSRHAAPRDQKSSFVYALSAQLGTDGPRTREESVWKDIDVAFSTPISPSDELADYVPTQILCELFFDAGFDGVAYRSSVGPGTNIVLFRLDDIVLHESRIARIDKIEMEFTIAAGDGLELEE